MDKILVVEDSKMLAKYLVRKISSSIDDIQTDTVSSFTELKDLLAIDADYSLALLDVYLPDMQDTELIEYVLAKGIPTVVMTGDFDIALYQKLIQKNIVDFVLKDSTASLEYIVNLTKRILKNKRTSVLVVDDSITVLHQIQNYLQGQLYQVQIQNDPLKALESIAMDDEISIVITDYNMPHIDGVEFLQKLRLKKPKDELGVIGISTDAESATKFLKFGANDFINKPFNKEEFAHRVNNLAQNLENIKILKDYGNQDFLTKLYNRKYFFEEGNSYYKQVLKQKNELAIAMIDIDDFKHVNDTYGHDIGDKVIKVLANKLKAKTKGQDLVARFGGEEFCVLLKNIQRRSAKKFFEDLSVEIASTLVEIDLEKSIHFTVSIGVSTKPLNSLEEMIKEADIHLYEAKQSGKNCVVLNILEEVS